MTVPPLAARPPQVQLWMQLDRFYPVLNRQVTGRLATFGVTTPQFRVLRQIQAQDRSPGEIAERLGVTPGNMTGIVDRLEQDGLLRRVRGEDRRFVTLQITPAGLALLETAVPRMHAHLAEVFSPLSASEIEQLRDMLSRLESHVGTMRAAQPESQEASA